MPSSVAFIPNPTPERSPYHKLVRTPDVPTRTVKWSRQDGWNLTSAKFLPSGSQHFVGRRRCWHNILGWHRGASSSCQQVYSAVFVLDDGCQERNPAIFPRAIEIITFMTIILHLCKNYLRLSTRSDSIWTRAAILATYRDPAPSWESGCHAHACVGVLMTDEMLLIAWEIKP